ncbi:hypothetical protein [Parasitella parasitica]|uniref:Uncharacterized protein n=1 Tax=Parasitella parasitica TaxID=35722 RepID=A0A0B7N7W4_9FUNG|nr:hypothetical protein [Parasitella parasitica]
MESCPAIEFASFGLCSFVMGIYNAGIVTSLPQVVTSVALSYGALGQYTASVIEILQKNVFAAASFFTFAILFLAFGIMMIPGAGFLGPAVEANELEMCMGLIEIAYSIAAFILFLGTFRQPILVRMILALSTLSFLFSAIGAFTGVVVVTKIGGWFSFTLALVAWYALAAMIYNETNTFIRLPFF